MEPDYPATDRGSDDDFPRQLILVGQPSAGLRAIDGRLVSAEGLAMTTVNNVLQSAGAKVVSLFDVELGDEVLPPLSLYFWVTAPEDSLDSLAATLITFEAVVAGAYVKPATSPASNGTGGSAISPATRDFSPRQAYLDPAPVGIDAGFAWTVAGGTGAGVKVVDVEWGWNIGHEDLPLHWLGVLAGKSTRRATWVSHGTAVVGVIGAAANGYGVTGIAPEATIGAVAIGHAGSSWAIQVAAAQHLGAGDILVVEVERPGPRQGKEIAIEWWPDDFEAIRFAASRGILVVAAAGNGGESLNHPAYDQPQSGFPAWWKNPFGRGAADSGSILVGGGWPPPGTHGRAGGPDRSRWSSSNYGRCVDAQGWAVEVTTCGYGDLQNGGNPDRSYTDRFYATSSATAIVAGALACAQGARIEGGRLGRPPLTPGRARECLRTTGSLQLPQSDRSTRRIGNRPDLSQLLPCFLA